MMDQPIPDLELADQPQSPAERLRRFVQDNAEDVLEALEPVTSAIGDVMPTSGDFISGVADATAEVVPQAAGKVLEVAGDVVGKAAEVLPEVLGKAVEALPDLISD